MYQIVTYVLDRVPYDSLIKINVENSLIAFPFNKGNELIQYFNSYIHKFQLTYEKGNNKIIFLAVEIIIIPGGSLLRN